MLHAASLDVTVTPSEAVIVTGAPRLALDVGGVTHYASFAGSTGQPITSLSFRYAVQAGDFDADGVGIAAEIDLNGATIADVAGNPLNAISFVRPDTARIKIQTYTAAFTSTANPAAISFAIAKAPLGASFSYTISSSGGLGTVTGSGTVTVSPQPVPGVDVSALAAGTLTLTVTISNASGTGEARTASFTPSLTGAFDSLPAAALLYSVRRLRGAYTGNLLRVRRVSDSAERNIAATIAGNLDTTALASFCAAESCFVTTWYDQSGNGRNAVQSVAAGQPRMFSAGATEQDGTQSRATLRFTGDGQLLSAPVLAGQSLDGTFNAVARVTDVSVNRHIMGDRGQFTATGRVIRAVAGGASFVGFNTGGAVVTLSGATTEQRVVTIWSGASGMAGALNGAATTGTANTYYGTSPSLFWIGGGGDGQSAIGDWIGTMSELAVFNFAIGTADRQTLERSQGSYFGVAVP